MEEGVIINADDYAMDACVDSAILKLAAEGVVTATSAMVLSPTWPEAAGPLADAPLSRGLHLDFTSPFCRRHLSAPDDHRPHNAHAFGGFEPEATAKGD